MSMKLEQNFVFNMGFEDALPFSSKGSKVIAAEGEGGCGDLVPPLLSRVAACGPGIQAYFILDLGSTWITTPLTVWRFLAWRLLYLCRKHHLEQDVGCCMDFKDVLSFFSRVVWQRVAAERNWVKCDSVVTADADAYASLTTSGGSVRTGWQRIAAEGCWANCDSLVKDADAFSSVTASGGSV